MLRFQRIPGLTSAHYASDDTKRYRVIKETGTLARTTSAWRLEILNLVLTAGVQHTVGQPVLQTMGFETRTLACAVARAYNELGDDYRESEHGHRSRFTEAVQRAYDNN